MMEDLQRECDLVGVLTDAPITIKVTHDPGLTHGASACCRWRWWVWITAQTCIITKDVKNGSYCSYVKCATLIHRVEGMHWPKIGATHFHELHDFRTKVEQSNS